MHIRFAVVASSIVLSCVPAVAQTTGLTPLNDLGAELYQGFPGGLYPGGQNAIPVAHRQAALQRAAQITPRDSTGLPDPNGSIAMVAIGMSNTTHEFAAFERNEDVNQERNARVVLMDTALGGQSAAIIANPDAAYWSIVDQRLAAMGLTPQQVQVVWLKEANANPSNDFPLHAIALRDDLEAVVQNLHDRFENLKLCYVSSRTYGGYATIPLNPEPQAYESGFSVKWLIEDQINGDPDLNYGQLPGAPPRSPLLLWGPYLWADGLNPRSDGLVWLRSDFEADGTHPSPDGEQKVAGLLSDFFPNEITARSWWPRQGEDAVLLRIDADKDATVDGVHPDMNFGPASQLMARGGNPPALIYAAFDAGSIGSLATPVKLSLRVLSSGGGVLSEVADTTWDETTITFTNRPEVGSPIVEMPNSSRDGTIAADVTSTVASDADGRIGFALGLPGSGQDSYHSREVGQPPRLVVAAPCSTTPDSDGDGRPDICDCSPADPTLFGRPDEVSLLRFLDPGTLAWSSAAPSGGSATVYDLMSGGLEAVSSYQADPDDVCVAEDVAEMMVADLTLPPEPGRARFYLVRAQNACGSGRYQTATSGRDRAAEVCL